MVANSALIAAEINLRAYDPKANGPSQYLLILFRDEYLEPTFRRDPPPGRHCTRFVTGRVAGGAVRDAGELTASRAALPLLAVEFDNSVVDHLLRFGLQAVARRVEFLAEIRRQGFEQLEALGGRCCRSMKILAKRMRMGISFSENSFR